MTTNVVRCTSLISHVTLRQKGLAPPLKSGYYKDMDGGGTSSPLHLKPLLSSQMKILPLLTLTLTTTASVVALQDQAQAADMTRQSQQAITQIYNHYKIDEAHWDSRMAENTRLGQVRGRKLFQCLFQRTKTFGRVYSFYCRFVGLQDA